MSGDVPVVRGDQEIAYAALGRHGLPTLRLSAAGVMEPHVPGEIPRDGLDAITDTDLAVVMREGLGLAPTSPQMVLSSDSIERKATPVYSGVFKYFPRALAAVSRLSFLANEKHNPGEPLHWSEGKSNDHKDALARHLLDAGTMDPEFGLYHDVGLAWRALANLETFLKQLEKDKQ